MYVPNHFKEDDIITLQQYIRQHNFATLIVADEQGIEANHLPFCISAAEEGGFGTLYCHLARNNPVWQRLQQGARVLVVFQGPNAYVSPSWYASKAETGRVVPTWNYLAVHAEGVAQITEDVVWLKNHLTALSTQHEASMEKPWALADAPADYTDRLIKAIVGVEIRINKLTGKLKASQNQSEQNRAGVKAALDASEHSQHRAMANFIR